MWRWAVLLWLLAFSPVVARSFEEPSLQRRGFPDYYKSFSSHEVRDGVARVVLKNGLTVVIEEYPLYPIVSVVTYMQTGRLPDTPAGRELAELEQRFSARRLDASAHRYGQDSQSFESLGALIHSTVVPEEGIFRALEAHAALLDPLEFSPSEFEFHLSSVRRGREAKVKTADPFQPAVDELERLFPQAESSAEGSEREPSNVDGQALQKFHSLLSRPGNVVLSVSGFVRREQILGKIVELYGKKPDSAGQQSLQTRQPDSSGTTAPAGAGFRYQHLRGNVSRPYVFLAFPIAGRESPDYPSVLLLHSLLSRGTIPLAEASLEEDGPAPYRMRASLKESVGRSLFVLEIAAREGQVDAAEADVLGWIETLRDRDIPAAELSRAKALLLTDLYLSLEQTNERAVHLARQEALGKLWDGARLAEAIAKLEAATLRKVMKRYFTLDQLTLLEFFPQQAEPRTFSTESMRETLNILLPEAVERKVGVLRERNLSGGKTALNLEEFKPSFVKGEFRRTAILRGPAVLLQEVHTAPIARLGIFYYGGRIDETPETAGLTEVMLRSLMHSFRRQQGIQQWIRLERWGSALKVVNEPDFFGFETTLISSGLAESLQLLSSWIRTADLQEVDVESARQELILELEVSAEHPISELFDSARSRFFAGHSYALSRRGTMETVKNFGLETVRKWQEQLLAQVHPVLLVRGDVEGTSFLQDLVRQLSEASFQTRSAVKRKFEAPSHKGRHPYQALSNAGGTVMVFEGPEKGSFPDQSLDVIENLVNGPSGLLNVRLQKDRLLVDSVQLRREAWLNGGVIYVHFEPLPQKGAEAEKAVIEVFQELTQRLSDDPQVLNAMVASLTKFYRFQQGGPKYLREAMNFFSAIDAKDAIGKYNSTIRQLTHEDLVAVVRAYLSRIEPAASGNEGAN